MGEHIFPTNGDILRHKKGKYYKVINSRVKHSESLEEMVVYQSIETKEVWARPWTMFTNDRFEVAIKVEDL